MAKGKITGVNNSTSTTGITSTVSATGATGSTVQGITTPPGEVLTGTLQDIQTGANVNFAQSLGAELGLIVGAKVNYNTVTVGGQVIANSVGLTHRGEIISVNPTNDGGMLLDKATNAPMGFQQQYSNESGLTQGTKVNYQRVIDPVTGAYTAVALVIVNP